MATLSFWGAAGTVTGSKYLVETEGGRILVDCGLFQGEKALRERNWQTLPFDVAGLDAIILTHAHIDHIGYLPRLVTQGFSGPIHCSRATLELARIQLPDSARLQEEEADYRNRHGLTRHQPALPLYTEADARETLKLFRPLVSEEELSLPGGMRARFYHAGHLLGARFIRLEIPGAGDDGKGRTVLFSGDLGRWERPILNDPEPPPACDYLLVESTYGDRRHEPENVETELARIVQQVAQRRAPLLVPSFAIGRTQDLLYILRELEDDGRIPILPVCVDSPMALQATRLYARLVEEHDAEYTELRQQRRYPLQTRAMGHACSREESKRLNDQKGARIIISAAGMMTGGRVLHHAQRLLPNPDATILFVGYQAAGTTGRRILDGEPEVKIFKQWFPTRCHVEKIGGLSGHADWAEILRWLEGMPAPPRQTFIIHGEPPASAALRAHIEEHFGWNVTLPQYGEQVQLR